MVFFCFRVGMASIVFLVYNINFSLTKSGCANWMKPSFRDQVNVSNRTAVGGRKNQAIKKRGESDKKAGNKMATNPLRITTYNSIFKYNAYSGRCHVGRQSNKLVQSCRFPGRWSIKWETHRLQIWIFLVQYSAVRGCVPAELTAIVRRTWCRQIIQR